MALVTSPSGRECQGLEFICIEVFEDKDEHKVAFVRVASATNSPVS